MAEIQDSTSKRKTRSGCFQGCFGFSGKVSEKKLPADMGVDSGGRKKTRWFPWSLFRKKKSASKTVPIDTSVSEKPNRSRDIRPFKVEKKASSKRLSLVTLSDQTAQEEAQKTRYENVREIILEDRANLDRNASVLKEVDTCQKGFSSNRRRAARRTGVGHPGSPESKSESGQTAAMLSHTVPFTPPKRKKAAANGVNKERPRQQNGALGEFDSMVGLSVVMVTLIIMLFWGKLCAIICTSAWFYFVPRLRTTVERNVAVKNGLDSGDHSDLNSEEHKKKVVLEGFLERNHKNIVGIL